MNLSTDTILTILELVVLGVLIFLNIMIFKKRKTAANRKNIEGVQRREQDLDRMLMNPDAKTEGGSGSQLRPYEEKYMSESKDTGTVVGELKIEIKVLSPMSEKKYLTGIRDRLSIGTGTGNDLVIDSHRAEGIQCVLIREKNALLFQKLSKNGNVVAERSHVKKTVSKDPIRVRSEDKFYLEDTMIEIRFV